MHPIICTIGPLHIYSYGVTLAIAVFICAFFLRKEARAKGFNPDTVLDLIFWAVLAGIVGARFFFILLNLDDFTQNPLEVVKLWHGGLAFQGGLIFGAIAVYIVLKKNAMPVGRTLDLIAPYVALGHAIGRVGCFFNGCCYGKEVAWGIYFPSYDARLHPTQLYESAGLLVIFFILKRFQVVAQKPGEVAILYLLLASILRFVNEFFRADHVEIWPGLSIFQIVSLAIFLVALYCHFLHKKH